jgi:signal transduction histidine kinase
MPPYPETQTVATDSRSTTGELAAALEEMRRELRRRDAECAALRMRNERLERELARLAADATAREETWLRAFQVQKMEAIGQLTGGIAHDFNNLLTVVSGGLYLLPLAVADPARCRQLIRRMEGAVGRGADVTRRLLAFARRQVLRPERIDLATRAVAFAALLAPVLGDEVVLDLDLPATLWPITADLGALELALLTIAENARDAMPRGGRFTLGAANVTLAAEDATGPAAGDYVQIHCTDTGAGMKPEVLAHAFEPFFTTKPVGHGSGLGLAQVHGFATQSGGTARVASRPGGGTTVFLLLPRAADPACGPAPAPA